MGKQKPAIVSEDAKIQKPVERRPPARKGIVKSGNAGNSSAASSSAKNALVPDDGRPPALFPAGALWKVFSALQPNS